ncbi:hypothetical protein FGO68_gene9823 [Halteria grandinella]|uniref:MORN repeat-containing protein n=1 Tax=Halteria grandinella TaxID=5974 RepID=A0A8J8NQ49_HALGN|nr:hypothetical protein FGO68_gene9823 [Halteria grandinella]
MKPKEQKVHEFEKCLQELQDNTEIHLVKYGPQHTTCILKREMIRENKKEQEESDIINGIQLNVLSKYLEPTENQNVWRYTIFEYDENFVKYLRDKKSGISDDQEHVEMLKLAIAEKHKNQRYTDLDMQYGCMEADNHQRWYRYNIARMAKNIQEQIEEDAKGVARDRSSPKSETSLLEMKILVTHFVNSSLLLAHHAIKSIKAVLSEEQPFKQILREHQTIFDDSVLNHLWQTYLPCKDSTFNDIFEKISCWHHFDEDLSDVDFGSEKRILQLRKGMPMPDGSGFRKGIYYGETVKGERHGKGILICKPSLHIYEAWFYKGFPIKGRAFDYTYFDSWAVQTGRFKNNYDLSGQGTRIRERYYSYEGELDRHQCITGYGQYHNLTTYFEGYFDQGCLYWGRIKKASGEVYEGAFAGGHLENGSKTFPDGKVLQVTNLHGNYKQGYYYTNAKMVQQNGDYQIGDWKDDVAIGVHRYYTKDDVFKKVSLILYIHIIGDNISLRDKMIKGIFSFVNYTQA